MGRITYASPSTGIKSLKDLMHPKGPLVAGVPEVISSIDMVLGLAGLLPAIHVFGVAWP